MKNYIILGSNNFWYSTLPNVTREQALKEVEYIKANSEDYPVYPPDDFFLYEVTNQETIN